MPTDQSNLIATLETDLKENVLPSPFVGESVVWYPANDRKNPHAAIVTALEEHGRCALTVFGRNAEPRYFVGVFHTSWKGHTAGNVNTTKNGSWDYPGGEIPTSRFKAHKEAIQKKLGAAKAEHSLFLKSQEKEPALAR